MNEPISTLFPSSNLVNLDFKKWRMITDKCYKYLSLVERGAVLCNAHRLGLTRTSVGATLSRHTSGSDQQKTVELPVSVDIKLYSRI
jgi:hypothetical protein